MRRLVLFLCLVANTAQAGLTVVQGGSGGASVGPFTPNTCLRADGSGGIVSAAGDCLNGDSAGTAAAYSGITNGTAAGKAFLMGAGSSLGRTAGGTIDASSATMAAQAQGWDSAPTDCGTAPDLFAYGQNANKSLKCRSVGFDQITGTATFSQVPLAFAATILSSIDPPTTDCAGITYQYGMLNTGVPKCKGVGFADLAAGTIPDTRLPDVATPGTFTNMGCNVSAKGRVSGCTSGPTVVTAPNDATYLLSTVNAQLPNGVSLGALADGILGFTVSGATATPVSINNSAGLAARISDKTGTGALVLNSSPALVGNPTSATTPSPGDNDTTLANTNFVTLAISTFGGTLSGLYCALTGCTIDGNVVVTAGHTVTVPADAGGGAIGIPEPSAGGTQRVRFRQTVALGADVNVEADSLRTIELCGWLSTITQNTTKRMGWIPGAGATPAGGTIVKAWCVLDGSVTTAPTIDVQECAQDGSSCATNGTLTGCGTTGATQTTFGGAAGAALDADDSMRFIVTNAASAAGEVLVCASIRLL